MTQENGKKGSLDDPMDDTDRWERFFESTVALVDPLLVARQRDPLMLIAIRAKRFAIIPMLLIAVLIPLNLALRADDSLEERANRLAQVSIQHLEEERMLTGAELSRLILGSGER